MTGSKWTVAFAAAILTLGAAAANGASTDRIAEGERFMFVHWNIGHFALGLAPATSIEAKDSAMRSAAYTMDSLVVRYFKSQQYLQEMLS